MKTVNLDKFKTQHKITLDGEQYVIRSLTLKEMVESDFQERMEQTEDALEKFTIMVEHLSQISSIPEEVLMEQEIGVLSAMMQVAQGVDPNEAPEEAPEEDAEDGGEEGNPPESEE